MQLKNSAGDECLPVVGENRPKEERLFISLCQQEASEESKMVEAALSTFNISCDAFVGYTFSFYLSLIACIAEFLDYHFIYH